MKELGRALSGGILFVEILLHLVTSLPSLSAIGIPCHLYMFSKHTLKFLYSKYSTNIW